MFVFLPIQPSRTDTDIHRGSESRFWFLRQVLAECGGRGTSTSRIVPSRGGGVEMGVWY